ncbi:hypothetical protein [Desulfobotulus sp.]|uniref:hypothetical protein n=1 Tax=Desulfobotulus sp. TaxID=1940337 RepID=UPI002A36EDD4|nr:hypothetical protein [Desulfobotulus sp.]MDY0162337.1 hypothetical protein [Desulfobotulus sp.]
MKGLRFLFTTPLIVLTLACPAQAMDHRRLADEELSRITAQASPETLHWQPSLEEIFQDLMQDATGYIRTRTEAFSGNATIHMQFDLTQEVSWDTFYYGGSEPKSMYASICDVYYRMRFFTPDNGIVSSSAIYGPSLLNPDGPSVSKIRIQATHVRIILEEARIGAIRIGPAPGEGKSFGSLILSGADMDFSGTIEIWPH